MTDKSKKRKKKETMYCSIFRSATLLNAVHCLEVHCKFIIFRLLAKRNLGSSKNC